METYIMIFLTIAWIVVTRLWVDKLIRVLNKPIDWPGGNIDGGIGEVVVVNSETVKITDAVGLPVKLTVDDTTTTKTATKKAGKKRGRKKKNQV